MSYPSAMQYVVELERDRASAVARAEQAEHELATANNELGRAKESLNTLRAALDVERQDTAELKSKCADVAAELAKLEKERDEAREGVEAYAQAVVTEDGGDVEEQCPHWLTVPQFCEKYGLHLPADWYVLDEPEGES